MSDKAKKEALWKCPKCGAEAGKHGAGGRVKCISNCSYGRSSCDGLICECDVRSAGDRSEEAGHGISQENPCCNANCYHCGWGGRLPALPKKMAPWEKKALAAGWVPPKGWGT